MSSIPPQYLRELKRHIRLPKYQTTKNNIVVEGNMTKAFSDRYKHNNNNNYNNNNSNNQKNKNNVALIGTLSLLGFSCSLPMLCFLWVGRSLTDQEEPLSASQIRRGPFLNSGSRDAGRDPKWVKGVYQKDEDYTAHFKRERNGISKDKDIDLNEDLFNLSQHPPRV
jgi:hypothetical protein